MSSKDAVEGDGDYGGILVGKRSLLSSRVEYLDSVTDAMAWDESVVTGNGSGVGHLGRAQVDGRRGQWMIKCKTWRLAVMGERER